MIRYSFTLVKFVINPTNIITNSIGIREINIGSMHTFLHTLHQESIRTVIEYSHSFALNVYALVFALYIAKSVYVVFLLLCDCPCQQRVCLNSHRSKTPVLPYLNTY